MQVSFWKISTTATEKVKNERCRSEPYLFNEKINKYINKAKCKWDIRK